ncbi:glycosyltransferase family 4 protein [Oleisolibacter albus]|uniref:glycosyltransferase family 4 protein n=1 Tax=Oleisolibacter albus TaxID=2171757 RepID=UPI000DF1716E|nr:glycosyltransferase family 4 protein [Oleisolibacter albus]
MRICYIAEAMSAGVGRHVVDLSRGMVRRGHHVHLIYAPNRADPALLAELEEEPGLHSVSLPMERSPTWRDGLVLLKLSAHLRRYGPFDILHGHSSKAGLYSRLLGLLSTAGSIYTPHAFITMSPGLSPAAALVYRMAELGLSLASSRVVCTSGLERTHAHRLGISARRLAVIHNGIQDRGFEPREDLRQRLGLPSRTLLVGFVGRLEYQKGIDVLLAAMPLVQQQRADVHLVMIGSGSLQDGLRRQATAAGLEGCCTWLGEQPARAYLPGFDLLVMPSRYEGLSYSLMEALHCGLPVICTPVGGAAEAIQHGVSGLIIPREDSAALAEAILRLARDPALRSRMGVAARALSDRFTIDRMCAETEALYYGRPLRKAQITAVRDQPVPAPGYAAGDRAMAAVPEP